jgi:hypothetical protein
MKISALLKHALLTMCFLLFCKLSQAQLKDSLLYPYKILPTGLSILANSINEADYFRIIYPYTEEQSLIDVKEFYKDGKLKLVGQAERRFMDQSIGYVNFIGKCISFFPSGKRERIANYTTDGKDGEEYIYYPSGKLFKILNNVVDPVTHNSKEQIMDCFDKNGKQICTNGDGKGLEYDYKFNNIEIEGPVVDGKREGDWRGKIPFLDSSNYIITYKKNEVVSSIGYDTLGKPHPFKYKFREANYVEGFIGFVSTMRKNLKLPKGTDAKKIVDSATLSFTINENGSLTDIGTVNPIPSEILSALKQALGKCSNWTPSMFYGIPLKSKVQMSLKINSEYVDKSYQKSLTYNIKTLYRDNPLVIPGYMRSMIH